MTIALGFEIAEASKEDMDEVFQVLLAAYAGDEVWHQVFKNCKQEDIHPWIMANLNGRWTMPDIKTFKVTDISTKYVIIPHTNSPAPSNINLKNRKIAAWTALEYPWKYVPEMDDDLKGHALSEELPPALEGMNMEALLAFFISLTDSKNHGWNPEEDYHRKGTMVHPDYQKRGFGTELTKHCNAISDGSGDRTGVPARPTSVNMFRKNGFKDIGSVDAHLERWGGSREKSITWTLLRNATSF
ncbi:hypothetical protein ONS95_003161 [Cadophora gregata]|uniref:uncharacterized protein n=1 Tax=Cadophora gregata TaxID=51156 RepID=UPI0026DD31AC|nr:uncharacterized protein ONS95_003161 [Cadophora gregata]KAK0108346.1 hypothetical protein ONS95_003161 [Cadophora gregata]KAK0109062.1 hypothetical protein ONS96_002891 [Cadophora gregata f. sp. sojae]